MSRWRRRTVGRGRASELGPVLDSLPILLSTDNMVNVRFESFVIIEIRTNRQLF